MTTKRSKFVFVSITTGLFAALLTACSISETVRATEPGKLELVANGQAKAVIVLPEAPSPAATEGAEILSDHIFQMSGCRLKVIKEKELGEIKIKEGRIVTEAAIAENFVLVGESRLAHRLGLDSNKLGPGGILIQTTANALVLFGPDERTPSDVKGTRYAVTTFLEDSLGVRYLWPGELGKIVPKRKTIAAGPVSIRFTPMLKQRKIRSVDHRKLNKGLVKLGLTLEEYKRLFAAVCATKSADGGWFRWHRLGGKLGLKFGDGTFSQYPFWETFGPDAPVKENRHPEWFALQLDGTRDQSRRPDRPRLCKSNRELIKYIAQEKIDFLDKNPEDRISISLCPSDGSRNNWCMCDACQALDPKEGRKITLKDFSIGNPYKYEYVSLTDRVVHWWNGIADIITQSYPDILIGGQAYSVASAPPVKQKLHPNMVIRFVPISYNSDEKRRQGLKDWDAWAAMASKIYWRPNFINRGKREGTPLVYVHKLAEDFSYLAHHSMIGTDFDKCVHNWATQGLVYYAAARLNWDPDLDIDALINDYCRAGFGSAAEQAKRYFMRIEELTDISAALTPGDASPKEVKYTVPYTPEVIKELYGILDEADRAAGGDRDVRARIAFLRRGLDFTDIQAQAYRLLWKAQEGGAVDKAEARRLLDKRYAMMHDIFRNDHLVANVGFVCWGEGGRFKKLGWQEPGKKSR